jgi:glycosyltransferase involved in cell wall biosynthesis
MLEHVRAQTVFQEIDMEILICLDSDDRLNFMIDDPCVRVINSDGKSQAKALNAGLRNASKRYIAFCEDDDFWGSRYLEIYCRVLSSKRFAFLSSNQCDIDLNGNAVRISDFPTPSTWLFDRNTIDQKFLFDETYRWHLDNEFLGQINSYGLERGHIVDSSALNEFGQISKDRGAIKNLIQRSWGLAKLIRHDLDCPLVFRQLHDGSGMAKIASDELAKNVSLAEYARLQKTYGVIPN